MKGYKSTYKDVVEVALPMETRTYKPISNIEIITEIRKQAKINSLTIQGEGYRLSNDNNIMTSMFAFTPPQLANELSMMVIINNSYDHKSSLSCGIGALVLICSNGVIRMQKKSDMRRAHKGNIQNDLTTIISETLDRLKPEYAKLVDEVTTMQNLIVPKAKLHEIVGRLYFEENILNTSQMSLLKRNSNSPKNPFRLDEKELTLWKIYNNVTETLKYSHPKDIVKNHLLTHKFFTEKV